MSGRSNTPIRHERTRRIWRKWLISCGALLALSITAPLAGRSAHAADGTIAVTPLEIAFGDVQVGDTSGAQTVTVTNEGPDTATVSAIPTGPFHIVDGCGTLAGGAACTISVRFRPTNDGAASGTLTVSVGSSSAQSQLSGFGVVLDATLAPDTRDFGAVPIGSYAESTVVLRNTSNRALDIGAISATGPFSIVSSPCGSSLALAASCTITVRFDPAAAGGAASGALNVQTAAGLRSASLIGHGAALSVSTSSVDLDAVTVGQSDSTMVTVRNLSTDLLSVTLSSVDEPFASTDNCPDPLPGGASCDVTVTFSPVTTEPSSSSFTVTADQTHAVAVVGRGAAVDLDIAAVDAGTVPVGETNTGSAAITNMGDAAVTIADVTASGAFTVTSTTCIGVLAPAQSCQVGVTFAPVTPGTANGTLTVHHVGVPTTGGMQGFGVVTGVAPVVPPTARSVPERPVPPVDALDDSPVGFVHRMYLTLFARVGDAPGLAYWTSILADGVSTSTVVSAFIASAEWQAVIGETSNTEFVQMLYTKILGRPADAVGAEYWSELLAAGKVSRSHLVTLMVNSPELRAALRASH